jgi:prepilin-type N-terminal cleavage/methylation domain-containing protein
MKLPLQTPTAASRWETGGTALRRAERARSGFTMIEIAVALGVIAIAMIAVLGVLPLGLNVQKENREKTVINEDARLLIDAIREGGEALYSLSNHVEAIMRVYTNTGNSERLLTNTLTLPNYGTDPAFVLSELPSTPAPQVSLTNSAFFILAALSTPQGVPVDTKGQDLLFHTVALMRSMSGGLLEQVPGAGSDLSFHYYVTVEVAPFVGFYSVSDITNAGTGSAEALQNLYRQQQVFVEANNVHELRLTYQWPVLPNGRVGVNRQVYRTLISGIPQQAIFPLTLGNREGLFYNFHSQVFQPQPSVPVF